MLLLDILVHKPVCPYKNSKRRLFEGTSGDLPIHTPRPCAKVHPGVRGKTWAKALPFFYMGLNKLGFPSSAQKKHFKGDVDGPWGKWVRDNEGGGCPDGARAHTGEAPGTRKENEDPGSVAAGDGVEGQSSLLDRA